MRVAFVTALPPERSSGVGRILPLARATARAGHVVTVLALSGRREPPDTAEQEADGVRTQTVGPALRATDELRPRPWETLRRLRAGRAALAAALADQPADVLVLAKPQLQNTRPVLAHAAARRLPLLVDADDLEAAASRLPLPARWYADALERRAARAATAITACSPFLVERYRAWNPAARVMLLPTGIEIPRDVPPARLRERLGLPTDARIILYVGSLSLTSGHRVDLLLEAYATRTPRNPEPDAHLVLAGDGLDTNHLRALADARCPKPDRVHFLGRFSPPEDLALAREADLLVDPVDRTPTNEAKSSHRVMLALATGTPVVAGNVGIRRALLPLPLHGDCLYDPDDPLALPAALARGLDPAFRARFHERTIGLISQWTWETLGKQFVSLLPSLTPRAMIAPPVLSPSTSRPAPDGSRGGVDLPSGHGVPPTGGTSEGDRRSERASVGRANGDARPAGAQGRDH